MNILCNYIFLNITSRFFLLNVYQSCSTNAGWNGSQDDEIRLEVVEDWRRVVAEGDGQVTRVDDNQATHETVFKLKLNDGWFQLVNTF